MGGGCHSVKMASPQGVTAASPSQGESPSAQGKEDDGNLTRAPSPPAEAQRPTPPERSDTPFVFCGIASLVDGSLLRQEEGAEGEPRFRMLETVREYGLERLADSGESDATRDRLAAWCLALADRRSRPNTGAISRPRGWSGSTRSWPTCGPPSSGRSRGGRRSEHCGFSWRQRISGPNAS